MIQKITTVVKPPSEQTHQVENVIEEQNQLDHHKLKGIKFQPRISHVQPNNSCPTRKPLIYDSTHREKKKYATNKLFINL